MGNGEEIEEEPEILKLPEVIDTPPVEVLFDADEVTVDEMAQKISEVPEKSVVALEMNGKTEIDKTILESAKGRDVDIILDMGDYSWKINGYPIII